MSDRVRKNIGNSVFDIADLKPCFALTGAQNFHHAMCFQEIPGLTDKTVPRRLGPKRASKIKKLFNLSKEDDVRNFVIKRPLPLKEGQTKPKFKKPKIQRLITPVRLQVSFPCCIRLYLVRPTIRIDCCNENTVANVSIVAQATVGLAVLGLI